MNKTIIGIIIVVLVAAGTYVIFNQNSKNSSTNQNITASSQTKKTDNQKKCEEIISLEKINEFSGLRYEYQEEQTGFSGDFSCFFLTAEGTGSRTLDYKLVKDPDKTEFEAAKGIGENQSAPEFADAYYTKGEFMDSKLPEWSLHVNKDGKTYIVDVIQYKSEAETKAFMKQIMDKLMTEM